MARDARCRISYLLIPSIMQRKLELARFPCSFRVVFCRPSFGRRNEISCTYLLLLKKKENFDHLLFLFRFFLFLLNGAFEVEATKRRSKQRQRGSASERPSDQSTFRADATCITATSKWHREKGQPLLNERSGEERDRRKGSKAINFNI